MHLKDDRYIFFMLLLLAVLISAAVIYAIALQTLNQVNDLGKCVVGQTIEHRLDVRTTHESLSGQHNDFRDRQSELPPSRLDVPRAQNPGELLAACEEYLIQGSNSSRLYRNRASAPPSLDRGS